MMGLSYRMVSLVLAVLVAAVPGYCACEGHRGAAAGAEQQKPACGKCEKRVQQKQTSHSQDSEHCPTCKMTAEAKRAEGRMEHSGAIHLVPALLPAPVAMLTGILVPQEARGGEIIIPHRLVDLVHSSCQLTN